jgi:glycosyltransferase involved in cell wall biosynthesis
MHIGINAQLLSIEQGYRNGGISRYIRYLLNELAKQPGKHTYTVFVNGEKIARQLEQHPQINYVPATWPEGKPAMRVLWEQCVLPSLIRQKRIDVLHSTANVRPELLPASCASVVTLHDLAFKRFPQVLTRAKRIYHQTFTVHSIRRATLLVTVSESTRRDAHELVQIPMERMQTVYPCIDGRFSNHRDEQAIQTLREQQGLTDGFLLYMATLEPRKNLPTLIEAYGILRQKYGVREKLVLAGGKGWLYESLFKKVRQSGLEADILFPGFVSDKEQIHWYQAASVFVYPSLYEGFGMPVAEALACGTPVVTSNISSLPEAGADLALCVDPHDAEALADALYRGLTDQAVREKCQTLAPAIAQKFSARTMVSQLIDAYERAAELKLARRT